MAQAKQAIKFWMCGTCKWKNPITNNYCENCTEERPKQGCVVQVMTKQMLLNDWQQRKEIKNLNQGAKGTGAAQAPQQPKEIEKKEDKATAEEKEK